MKIWDSVRFDGKKWEENPLRPANKLLNDEAFWDVKKCVNKSELAGALGIEPADKHLF